MTEERIDEGFDDVLGHEVPKRLLASALRAERLPHAYLFHGPEGVGKRTLALRFAARILAEAAPAAGRQRRDAGAVLRRILHDVHPDVVVFAVEDGADTIGVERIRDFETEISKRPFEGGPRVFLLDEAHRMTDAASNALLKTLEEPPDDTVTILLADRTRSLLPTIRSRCQSVAFRSLPVSRVEAWLAAADGIESSDAPWLAACSEGSIGRAVRLSEEGFGPIRRGILDRLERGSFADGGSAWIGEVCREGTSTPAEVRARIRTFLGLATLALRDVVVLSRDEGHARLYHGDRRAGLAAVAARSGLDGAVAMLDGLFEASRWVDRNANLELIFENLAAVLAGETETVLPGFG